MDISIFGSVLKLILSVKVTLKAIQDFYQTLLILHTMHKMTGPSKCGKRLLQLVVQKQMMFLFQLFNKIYSRHEYRKCVH